MLRVPWVPAACAQNQWKAFLRHPDDSDPAISNNAAENTPHGIAIGSNNFPFVGSDRGGRTAGTLYSLASSATHRAPEVRAKISSADT